MEDRFRYRAWKKIDGVYDYDIQDCKKFPIPNPKRVKCYSCFQNYLNFQGGIIEVEQCTGLHDMNGKLIYENDIVDVDYYNTYWKVIYQEKLGKYCLDNNKGHIKGIDQFLWSNIKVIGNIHENHELLEEK